MGSPKKLLGAALVAMILGVLSISAGPTEEDKKDDKKGVLLEFVLTAMDLPVHKGLFGVTSPPTTYVAIQYWEKKGDDAFKSYKTSEIEENSNPEFPNIVQVTFHDGQGQRIKFIVKDGKGKDIGHASTSVKKIFNTTDNRMSFKLLGPNDKNGQLELETLIGGFDNTNDDTDLRLAFKKRKASTTLNLDMKPKRKPRRNEDADDDDDD